MKNNNKKILFSLVLALLLTTTTLITAKEKPDPRTGRIPPPVVSLAAVNNLFMQANNINTIFRTDGYFNLDKINYTGNGAAGMIWPVSAPQRLNCDFSTGIWIAGLVGSGTTQQKLRTAVSLYNTTFTPGGIPVQGSVPPSSVCQDPKWKGYHVQLTNPNLINGGSVTKIAGGKEYTINFDAWSAWPVDLGAPYVEVNGIPGYQPGPDGDRPGIGNSDAIPDDIIYFVFMDYTNCTNAVHQAEISLPGGTLPLGVEVHQLAFAFNSPGLTNMYFTKYYIINKSSNLWDSTFISIVNDVDLGDANDDAAGCDSTKSLGFIYNGDNSDPIYGSAPPCVGSKYLQSPIVFTGNPADSVKLPYDTLIGYTALGMTGFNTFLNVSGDPCRGDPDNAFAGYNFMKGYDGCGVATYNYAFNHPTKYKFTGSYCGGLSGWYDSIPGDKRCIQGSGPFTMNPNDTQIVTLGLFVERSSDNISSVCKVINNSGRVQRIYDNNFRSIPLPPAPQVNAVADGDGKITLYWGSLSESYHTFDKIDLTGYWDFQGYEVYQIKPGTGGENEDERSLLAVYDLVDTIDNNGGANHIWDSVEVTQPNGNPAWEMKPVTFGTNNGLSRIITLTQNKFPNGVNNFFINGQTYRFAVIAYGVNGNAFNGSKVLRNQIGAQVFSVIPNYPIMGTVFNMKNLDTLATNRIDRSFLPIVVDPKKVVSARYQMVWATDTSWNIVRIMNSQVDTVAKNSYNFTAFDNRAYIIDGVLFKADTINRIHFGVINDPGPGAQTSGKGWSYTGSNPNFAGVDTSVFVNFLPTVTYKPFQSMSMGLSWPSGNTYKSGFTSKIDTATFLKQSGLKRVKFNFGQTQKAYRYRGAINNSPYQDYVDVPFTVTLDDPLDTNGAPRQLNCAFYDYDSSGTWNPKARLDGGLEMVFVMYSSYDPNPLPFYTTKNIQFSTQFKQMDVQYVWWPRVLDGSRPAYTSGDVMTIFPYTRLQHFQSPGMPTVTEVSTSAPTIGSNEVATQRGEMEDIRVVPNPYYGGHANESSPFDRFVRFTRMPKACNIFIYSLNGNLVRKIVKDDNNTSINWDLLNTDQLPVASGIYIAYIDAPGIGTKVVKLAIFTPEERIDKY